MRHFSQHDTFRNKPYSLKGLFVNHLDYWPNHVHYLFIYCNWDLRINTSLDPLSGMASLHSFSTLNASRPRISCEVRPKYLVAIWNNLLSAMNFDALRRSSSVAFVNKQLPSCLSIVFVHSSKNLRFSPWVRFGQYPLIAAICSSISSDDRQNQRSLLRAERHSMNLSNSSSSLLLVNIWDINSQNPVAMLNHDVMFKVTD